MTEKMTCHLFPENVHFQAHLAPQAALVHQDQKVGLDTVVVLVRPVNRVSTVVRKTRCRASWICQQLKLDILVLYLKLDI